MSIEIRPIDPTTPARDPEGELAGPLGFGKLFAPRMFSACYKDGHGWYDIAIHDYQKIPFDPAALVFHYAQEIFEGLKAYRQPDGGIALFRPDRNAWRMNSSAQRLAMPTMPEELQIEAFTLLVKDLADWVPSRPGASLYLRPTMFATNAVLGVQPGDEYLYYVIASPVDAYFKGGFKPVSLMTSREYVRAAVGGTGAAKCGGNYAASLLAGKQAKKAGYDQVIWLDAKEHRYIEEMGGMNIFFVYGDTLCTSPLTGSILPGITRDSILKLAATLGLKVRETMLDVDQTMAEIDQGLVTEVFACGTAAVVSPVGRILHDGVLHEVNGNEPGAVTSRLHKTLTDLQFGLGDDPFGWRIRVV